MTSSIDLGRADGTTLRHSGGIIRDEIHGGLEGKGVQNYDIDLNIV